MQKKTRELLLITYSPHLSQRLREELMLQLRTGLIYLEDKPYSLTDLRDDPVRHKIYGRVCLITSPPPWLRTFHHPMRRDRCDEENCRPARLARRELT